MRKNLSYMMLLFAFLFTFSSCDKIKEQLFKAFAADGGSIDFTIPIVASTSTVSIDQELNTKLNLDSIIRKNTNGMFGINDINKVSIESAELIINNPDLDNNLQNLESFSLSLINNSPPNEVTLAAGNIEDVYASTLPLNSAQGVDLKPFLTGTQIFYLFNFKARKITTKPLECTLRYKFKVE
jgi:hypothetical protein